MLDRKKDLFENKPVLAAVLSLALPSVAGQIILVIYNMADTLFVGFTGSDELITAITVCMPAFMFLSAISNLFGIGAASVISRAHGRSDRKRARNATSFAIWGCIAVTVLYCLGVTVFCDGFVNLLGGSASGVHPQAKAYMLMAVVLGGLPASISTLMSHIIRAGGYSGQASVGIIGGGVLNIILDPLFMFVLFPKGSEPFAAATATAVSNAIALVYYLFVGYRHRVKLNITAKPEKEMFSEGIPKEVLTVGIPACLMTLCENISYAILDRLMVSSGTAAQAGVGVAKKVNMLAHCFVRGMSQGVLPLIGYNYASGNRKRMKKVVGVAAVISVAIACICTTVNIVFGRELVSLFIQTESESLDYGTRFLQILCIGAPFSAFAYTVISFFQATGYGSRSLILALLRKGILDIPLMFLLSGLIRTYGIVLATPTADIICCGVSVVLFVIWIGKHGKNKMRQA